MEIVKSNDETLDRLSALPDSLIHQILFSLGMRSIVRTAILSKRLNYIWITTPYLHFQNYYKDIAKFLKFVNRALMLWRGTYVRKFSINFFRPYKASEVSSDMDSWMLFAMEKKVEELWINRDVLRESEESFFYHLPQSIYECSSMRKLSLNGCNLRNCGNVKWDRLICLDLFGCLLTEDVINQIVSSSPRLETFSLDSPREEYSDVNIQSCSLKKLSIYTPANLQLIRAVLTIWAPNLEALLIIDNRFRKCELTNVSSLTEVSFKFHRNLDAEDGQALCQIIPAFQHVATVNISVCCFKLLGVMKGKCSFSPFSPLRNVKLLRIHGGLTEHNELVCLAEIFPKLETLIVDWESVGEAFKSDADRNIMSEAKILKSNLLQLRTVKIIWFLWNPSIFEFIEFLLNHATVIEKMVIQRSSPVVDSKSMILAAQKVASLQRSFPSVELVLCSKMITIWRR